MEKKQENQIIYADPESCLGCHSCELSCAVAHGGNNLLGAVAAKLPLRSRNRVVAADGVMLPVQCRQCEEAPCTFACPTGSIFQEGGLVKIHERNCVGCKLCVMVCPFGAITVNSEQHPDYQSRTNRGVAKKCDLCADWRERNGKASPACVVACPTRAIELVDLQNYRTALQAARAKELAQSHKHLKMRKVKA